MSPTTADAQAGRSTASAISVAVPTSAQRMRLRSVPAVALFIFSCLLGRASRDRPAVPGGISLPAEPPAETSSPIGLCGCAPAARAGTEHHIGPSYTRRMDLELLERELAEAGEPSYRTDQVWAWAARGMRDYGQMTNLPAELRERLEERVPLSAWARDEATADDGTARRCSDLRRKPLEAVPMRFRDGRDRLRHLAPGYPLNSPSRDGTDGFGAT